MSPFFSRFGIESDKYYSVSSSISSRSRISYHHIERPCTQLLHKHIFACSNLHLKNQSLVIKTFDALDGDIILVANRDPVNVGPSQPHRDLPIGYLDLLIRKLLYLRFKIVRVNSIAEPISIDSPYFLDLPSHEHSQLDQFSFMSRAIAVIGSSSGICDVARVTYGIPNLLINGATCQTMNTFSRILHLTKYLIIDDSTILRKRTFLDLFYFFG